MALAASVAPLAIQLAFAGIAIGVIGMAHGASDLALVPRARRPGFLAAYALVSGACLVWWTANPEVALPLFLLASAIHFAVEDAPAAPVLERAARGAGLIAVPAALHPASYATILGAAGWGAEQLSATVAAFQVTGALLAILLLAVAWRRREPRLALGTAALLLAPPLVGFSLGFLILHALPQTRARRERLGCASDLTYLRAIAPVLAAALVVVAAVGALLLRWDPSGIRSLFAGIAALAMPHLLVTPWFDSVPENRLPRTTGTPRLA